MALINTGMDRKSLEYFHEDLISEALHKFIVDLVNIFVYSFSGKSDIKGIGVGKKIAKWNHIAVLQDAAWDDGTEFK